MEPAVVVLAIMAVVLGVVIGRTFAKPTGGSPTLSVPLREERLSRIRQLLGEGKKIEAMKELRAAQPRLRLKVAMAVVEAIGAGYEPPVSDPGQERAGGSHELELRPETLFRIRQLLGEGKKIQAIKELRESRPGMGLKDAKELVEAIQAGFEPGVGYGAPVGPAVGPGRPPGGEVLARVRQLLGEGKKIQAIKEYRASQPGVGMNEAKEVVEAIEAGYDPAAASVAAAPATAPEPSQVTAEGPSDLAKRVRELRDSGQETLAIRLVCDETGMGILDAQKFVRSLD